MAVPSSSLHPGRRHPACSPPAGRSRVSEASGLSPRGHTAARVCLSARCLPTSRAPRVPSSHIAHGAVSRLHKHRDKRRGAVTSAGERVQRRREPNVPCGYEAWTPCNHVSRAWASQSHEFPAGEGLGLVTPESRRQHLLQGTPARRRAGPASETLPCGDPCAPRLLPMPMVLLEAAPPRPQAAVSLGRPLPLARSRTCPQCPVGLLSEGRCLARCRPSPRGGPPSCWQPLTCTCHSTS